MLAPPNGQQTGSRFFTLNATDAVDESPDVFVVDTGSGKIFGPFPSGTNIKYTIRKNATPSQEPMTGAVQWHLSGNDEPAMYGADASENVSARIACPGGS